MASEKVKRIRDRRLNTWERMKSLADKAAGEDRVFTPREFGAWGVLYEHMDVLDRAIHEAVAQEAAHE